MGQGETTVRAETAADAAGVRAVHLAAFEGDTEADIVDVLRDRVSPLVSLVAMRDQAIVGHIIFSPVSCLCHPEVRMMGLGPMAVSPPHQGRGIGSRLVVAGLTACRRLECGAVVVLGHPSYYARFGFRSASSFGLDCQYDVPSEVFMALELESGALDEPSGIVRYNAAFGTA